MTINEYPVIKKASRLVL
jgi:hypothetical protein